MGFDRLGRLDRIDLRSVKASQSTMLNKVLQKDYRLDYRATPVSTGRQVEKMVEAFSSICQPLSYIAAAGWAFMITTLFRLP